MLHTNNRLHGDGKVNTGVTTKQTMDCFSSIFFLSFQDFYTIVLNELVLEVAARHRDDVLAQPSDQDYHRGRRHTAHRQYILWLHGLIYV
jgi:hypothetical protein